MALSSGNNAIIIAIQGDKVMKTIVTTIVALVMTATAANALTLKKGEVLTEDGVMHGSQSAFGQAQLADKGFVIAGGQLTLAIGEGLVTVDMSDLMGKSKAEMVELIGEAAVEQLEGEMLAEMAENVAKDVEEAREAGINAVLASDVTKDAIADAIENNTDIHVFVDSPEAQQALDEIHAELGVIEGCAAHANGEIDDVADC